MSINTSKTISKYFKILQCMEMLKQIFMKNVQYYGYVLTSMNLTHPLCLIVPEQAPIVRKYYQIYF